MPTVNLIGTPEIILGAPFTMSGGYTFTGTVTGTTTVTFPTSGTLATTAQIPSAPTIDGDTGSITGTTLTFTGSSTAGASVSFQGSGTTMTFHLSDASSNIFLGEDAGGTVISGASGNTAAGFKAISSITSGIGNVGMGYLVGQDMTTASYNIIFGYNALGNITSGSYNTAIGFTAGSAYTSSENSNILINNAGVIGDANTIRIGTHGSSIDEQNTCYIAGIAGVTVSNTNVVTINTVTGQLGSISTTGAILVIDGDTGSASGNTVTFNGAANSGVTVKFVAAGSTVHLDVTDSNSNTMVGNLAGKSGMSGSFNAGFGYLSGNALTSGEFNILMGSGVGQLITTGGSNTGMGVDAISSLVTGSYNIAVGLNAGGDYTGSESSNIIIGNLGMASESNVIRIGTQGTGNAEQNACYIAGITGVTTVNSSVMTLNTVTGQLGEVAELPVSLGGTGVSAFTAFELVVTGATSTAPLQNTVSSTANEVLVSNGVGIAPSFSSFLPGVVQLNITEVGTISTGTWQANVIFPQYGGTGANNGSFVINLDGNITTQGALTLMGAYGATFTFTNTTSVTFPTSGTLATVGGTIATIDGDTGSATGTTLTLSATGTSGSSVSFSASGSTIDLNVTDNKSNVLLGSFAGNSSLTGMYNCSHGVSTLLHLTSGNGNIVIGYAAGEGITTGSYNILFGYGSGSSLLTGGYNLCLGENSGNQYASSESSNICLLSGGTIAESNVIRIGTQGTGSGQQNKCFIAGITGVTTTSSSVVTLNTSTGQLGELAQLSLALGGTNASLTAAAGAIAYSTASALALTAAGSSGQLLASAGTGTPVWTTNTFPSTDAKGDILYASAANTIGGLAIGSTGQILTIAAGLPAWSTATYPATTTSQSILYSTAANTVGQLAAATGGVIDVSSSGNLQCDTTNFTVLSTGLQLRGNNTNTAPSGGQLGEYKRAVASASALTTGTAAGIVSLTLTPGIWNMDAISVTSFTGAGTATYMCISSTSASFAGGDVVGADNYIYLGQTNASAVVISLTIPNWRILVPSGGVTYYLNMEAAFTTGSTTTSVRLSATRVG